MPELTDQQLRDLLRLERFPRSSAYEPRWQTENHMGPNALWLTEFLCEEMDLRPGMRVLDLGCGKVLSSVFLAKEFGVQVWATDLWIPAAENLVRIRDAGLEDVVFPVHADARSLPYGDGFFDAVVSVDAFHYFGTDDLYLPLVLRHLKTGGRLGIVVPSVDTELEELPPSWEWELCTFHTPAWWNRHWSITRLVEVEVADTLPDGRDLWILWAKATGWDDEEFLTGPDGEPLGFARVIARKVAGSGG